MKRQRKKRKKEKDAEREREKKSKRQKKHWRNKCFFDVCFSLGVFWGNNNNDNKNNNDKNNDNKPTRIVLLEFCYSIMYNLTHV